MPPTTTTTTTVAAEAADVEGERLLELASRRLRGGECDEFDECNESTLMRNANGVVVCRPFPRRGHRALACLSSWAVMLFVAMIVVGSNIDESELVGMRPARNEGGGVGMGGGGDGGIAQR